MSDADTKKTGSQKPVDVSHHGVKKAAFQKYGPFGAVLVTLLIAAGGWIDAQTRLVHQQAALLELQKDQSEDLQTGAQFEDQIDLALRRMQRNDEVMLDELDRRFILMDRRVTWLEDKVVPVSMGVPAPRTAPEEPPTTPVLETTEDLDVWGERAEEERTEREDRARRLSRPRGLISR